METKNYYVRMTIDNCILERNNFEAQIHASMRDGEEKFYAYLFDVTPKDYDDHNCIREETFNTFKEAHDYLCEEAKDCLEILLKYAIENARDAEKHLEKVQNDFKL